MHYEPDLTWPVVGVDSFERVCDSFQDYRREAYADAILYFDKRTSRVFGFILNNRYYHIHPSLHNRHVLGMVME